ncbi:MAG: hypothetical protein E3K36_11750 [Candidatus Brocadia sp.]|nr:hypothetical protein [Candidatus Brocadia sp.]
MNRHKKTNLKSHILQCDSSKLSATYLSGFNFSKQIARKYTIFRKSVNLPVLIFLRLFGAGIVNKITNINRIESISNHYRMYLKIYFKTIGRLKQKYLYHVDHIETQRGAWVLSNCMSYLSRHKLLPPHLYPFPLQRADGLVRGRQDLYVRNGDRVSRNEIASLEFPLSVGGEGRLSGRQGVFFRSDMPTISYKYSKFLNHNVLKNAVSIQIIKSYPKTAFKTGSEKFVSERDTKENENIITLHIIPPHQEKRGGNKVSLLFRGEEKGAGIPLGQNLYFHNQRKIEQEVEEIKKIVVETKEAVQDTSFSKHFPTDMDKAIKQHLDINRISDQVYQNIERRIRIERERRGL